MTEPLHPFFAAQQSNGIDWLPNDGQLKTLRDGIFEHGTPPTSARTFKVGPLTIDLSGHWWNDAIGKAWNDTWRAIHTEDHIASLINGDPINTTEDRPAWHTALRTAAPSEAITDVHTAMANAYTQLRQAPPSGQTITDIVNIGVGGSDLGPCMVERALRPLHPEAPNVHFISNVDGTPLASLLPTLNPATTVFIICSKTFTTLETMTNFQSVREWMKEHELSDETIGHHLYAATSNVAAANALAISDERIFPMWDWVGGRYSVWSSIGLSLVLAYGFEVFEQLLAGAYEMDSHFANAKIEDNLPLQLAALDAWYGNYFGAQSLAVIPYESSLALLPDYLQQLMMESNGKCTTRQGEPVRWRTGQIIWGGVGTNTQHSFHQLLHQGTQLIPVDFFIGLRPQLPLGEHHTHLVANCLAQTEALAAGDTPSIEQDPLAPFKAIAGHKPFTLFHYDQLDARTLGAIVALYEHRVFSQSLLWDILPFDQWGVELGKGISRSLTPALQSATEANVPERLKPFLGQWHKQEHN